MEGQYLGTEFIKPNNRPTKQDNINFDEKNN